MAQTKEEKFASDMAQLLFEMRIESSYHYGNDCEPVPDEYALKIIDDPKHIPLIKKRIYNSVLENVTRSPESFRGREEFEDPDGYYYTADTYDHAFAVDGYLDELYEAECEAREKAEEAERQARVKVKFKVWVEVERIETDPENEMYEDYFDEECPVGISYVDTLEEAVELQEQIATVFGNIDPIV